jgi:hypothetical protein
MTLNFTISYFTNFLKNNGDEDIQTKWSDSIKDFKKALNKKTKKSGPKKNKSSYNLFCAEERLKVKEDLPDLGNKDIFAELAARWKTLKEKNSKRYSKYQKLADEDKVRYLKEKENFVDEEGDETDGGNKTKKKVGPKKPKSSYMFFCQEERPNIVKEKPDLSAKEVLVELGARWKDLKENSPNKVKKFETLATKDKERYNNEKNSSEEIEINIEEAEPVVEEEVVEEEMVVVEEPKPKKAEKKKLVKK